MADFATDGGSEPLIDGTLRIQDLVDMEQLRSLFVGFSESTDFAVKLVSHPDQELVFETGSREICSYFHRGNLISADRCKKSNSELAGKLSSSRAVVVLKCESGLVGGAAPIIIEDVHFANLFLGQVFFGQPDLEAFKRQGERFGYDLEAYLKAVREVPIVNEERFRSALSFLGDMAIVLAQKGLREKREILFEASRQRTEQALKESEEKYKQLSEATFESIFLSVKGICIGQNATAQRMFGYTTDEALGRPGTDWIHPDSRDLVMKKMMEGAEEAYEVVALRKDDTTFPCEIQARGFSKGGKNVRITAVRDITDRKDAQEALRQEKEFIDKAIDSLPGAFYMFTQDGKMLRWNQNFMEVTGYSFDEVSKMHPSEFFPEDEQALVLERIGEVFSKGRSSVEANILSKDGSLKFHLLTGKRLEVQGKPCQVGMGMDITERKESEKELGKLRNYLSNIIDSMPSILIGVDNKGRVTEWNNEAERATGIRKNIAVGQPLEEAFPRMSTKLEQVRDAMTSRVVRSDSRKPWKGSAETFYEDVTVYPLVTNGVEGAVIRVDDVTEQVRLEEMMIQSEKMLSVGGLAAGMAHEINNPLGGILQTIAVMNDRLTKLDMESNKQAAKDADTSMESIRAFMESRNISRMLSRINDAGLRISKIVDNMLSFARKDDTTWTNHRMDILLDKCIELAGSDYDMKKKYDFKKIRIQRDYAQDLPPVPCESGKIQQVFLNLLRNGAEAMQDEKGDKQSQFDLRIMKNEKRNTVEIEVEDNGPGMDDIVRKRVFEPFFTTKPTDQGTGLGLSVSYFIIKENHGGEMSVDSQPGKGSVFRISLPLTRQVSTPPR